MSETEKPNSELDNQQNKEARQSEPKKGKKTKKAHEREKPESQEKKSNNSDNGNKKKRRERSNNIQDVRLVGISREVLDLLKSFSEENARQIVDALGTNTDRVIGALGTQTVALLDAMGADNLVEFVTKEFGKIQLNREENRRTLQTDISTGYDRLHKAIKDEIEATGSADGLLLEIMGKNEKALRDLEGSQNLQNQLLEEQVPEHLRLPTPQRMMENILGEDFVSKYQTIFEKVRLGNLDDAHISQAVNDLIENESFGGRAKNYIDRGGDATKIKADIRKFLNPDEQFRSKLYQQEVEEWVEQRLEAMESDERSFEEQPHVFNRLDIAISYFKFRDETRALGTRFEKMVEARRIKKRMVRVHSLNTPENLMGQAGSFTKDHFKELFTYREHDGLNDFLKSGEEKKPERAIIVEKFMEFEKKGKEKRNGKVSEKDVQDYFKNGGEVGERFARSGLTADMTVKQAILHFKEIGDTRALSKQESQLLTELSKEFWAVRSAGELWSITFRAAEYDVLLNGTGDFFAARIMNFADRIDKSGYQKSRGFWDHDTLGKLDLGYRDFFTNAIESEAKVEIEKPYWDSNRGVLDISQFDLGSGDFWDNKFASNPQQYSADQIDKFIKADDTRKFFWGGVGFLQDPSLEKLRDMKAVFQHLSDKDSIEEATEKQLGVTRVRFNDGLATERQEKTAEMMKRSLSMMDTEGGRELLEELKIFPSSVKKRWINDASAMELVTNKQRDFFYLNTNGLGFPRVPLLAETPDARAKLRATIDNLLGYYRYPGAKMDTLFTTISELLRKIVNYTFQDELR
jgi:hypothetical protein